MYTFICVEVQQYYPHTHARARCKNKYLVRIGETQQDLRPRTGGTLLRIRSTDRPDVGHFRDGKEGGGRTERGSNDNNSSCGWIGRDMVKGSERAEKDVDDDNDDEDDRRDRLFRRQVYNGRNLPGRACTSVCARLPRDCIETRERVREKGERGGKKRSDCCGGSARAWVRGTVNGAREEECCGRTTPESTRNESLVQPLLHLLPRAAAEHGRRKNSRGFRFIYDRLVD